MARPGPLATAAAPRDPRGSPGSLNRSAPTAPGRPGRRAGPCTRPETDRPPRAPAYSRCT
eukprot:1107429-Lingulodinium_polyedra.AAC.1